LPFLGGIEMPQPMFACGCDLADRIFPRHLHRPRLDERLVEDWKMQVASKTLIVWQRRAVFSRLLTVYAHEVEQRVAGSLAELVILFETRSVSHSSVSSSSRKCTCS